MQKSSSPTDGVRRRALGALGSLALLTLAGCGGGSAGTSSTSLSTLAPIMASASAATSTDTTAAPSSAAAASTSTPAGSSGSTSGCQIVPEETEGPYLAEGSTASNDEDNVLALPGIVRPDIRSDIDSSVPVAGAPLLLAITLDNTQADCAPLAGYAVFYSASISIAIAA